MIKFLAENATHKVYSVYENVYLKTKLQGQWQDDYESSDAYIGWIYGDPTAAIILSSGDYVIVAGCGITIFNTAQITAVRLFCEPGRIKWTEGLHQSDEDDLLEFRFVSFSETNEVRVFRMHVLTHAVTMLD